MTISLYSDLSTLEKEGYVYDSEILASYFLNHLTGGDANYTKAIVYICETINAFDLNTISKLFCSSGFPKVAYYLLNEDKYLLNRSVPIAVDMALRFKNSNPSKAFLILDSYVNLVKNRLVVCESKAYFLLFFASQNKVEMTRDYIKEFTSLIQDQFENLSYDQLNRIFDSRNSTNAEAMLQMVDELIGTVSGKGLCRLYFLSFALFPDKREPICKKMLEFPVNTFSGVDKNLRELLQSQNLHHMFNANSAIVEYSKKNSVNKLKVAICVSGQLRGYKDAFDSWFKALDLAQVEYDFYISTWSRIGKKNLVAQHLYRYFPKVISKTLTEIWEASGEKKFRSIFSNLCKSIDSDLFTDVAEIKKVYKTDNVIIHQDSVLPSISNNAEKMCFKIEHAYNMAVASGVDYDLYIRIRPDKSLFSVGDGVCWDTINTLCNSKNSILTDLTPMIRTHQHLTIGDQVVIAGRENANVIFRPHTLHYYLNGIGGTSGHQNAFRGHTCLSSLCIAANIPVAKIPGVGFSDSNLLSANKPSVHEVKSALIDDYFATENTEILEMIKLLSTDFA